MGTNTDYTDSCYTIQLEANRPAAIAAATQQALQSQAAFCKQVRSSEIRALVAMHVF